MDTQTEHIGETRAPKSVFLAAFVVIFITALSSADSVGFVPCEFDATCSDTSVALSQLPQLGDPVSNIAPASLPARIEIPTVGIDLPVQNPATRDVQQLDDLLKQGPARYVDSAKLGQQGNVIIFAHSSHLPIVHNQMFRAFNNIPDLSQGDLITLVADDGTKYLYSVDGVARADVNDGTTIPLSASLRSKLTLVTCDTLTGKSARFVLTATLIGTI